MPEFSIPSARILLLSQIQGRRLPPTPAPLSGTPMFVLHVIFQFVQHQCSENAALTGAISTAVDADQQIRSRPQIHLSKENSIWRVD